MFVCVYVCKKYGRWMMRVVVVVIAEVEAVLVEFFTLHLNLYLLLLITLAQLVLVVGIILGVEALTLNLAH